MQINVAQLLKQAAGASRSYEIDTTLSFEELAEYHVQGEVELIRTEKGILVRGVFSGKSSLMCSRCLTLFDCSLTFKIEEEFFPSIDVISGIPLPLADDSTAFAVDEHHVLDLSESIRQYGLLAVPMKPLCRPDCAGLCPQCGANLNQGACHCVPGSQKSAWSELEKLNSIRKSR
jgi:uncharacterized protein